MLVISRRPEEKVLLPTVPATIKVISSQSGLVRLGIDAPSHVPILREELAKTLRTDHAAAQTLRLVCDSTAQPGTVNPSSGLRHFVRNRLNNLTLAMALLRAQLGDCACDPLISQTLDGLDAELLSLQQQVGVSTRENALQSTHIVGQEVDLDKGRSIPFFVG